MREINLLIEEHQGWLYAWDKDSNNFMGQADTVSGLFKRIAQDVHDNEKIGLKCAADDGGNLLKIWALTELEKLADSQDSAVLDIEVD